MTTAEMLEKVRDVVAQDVDFVRFCRDQLGTLPTVQIDFDEEQELGVECYPFVGIMAVKHSGAIQQKENIFTLRLLAAVRQPDLIAASVAVDLGGEIVQVKTRTYPGRLKAEALREQAILALYRGKLGKVDTNSDDMSHTYHPKFYSPFTVTIEERI